MAAAETQQFISCAPAQVLTLPRVRMAGLDIGGGSGAGSNSVVIHDATGAGSATITVDDHGNLTITTTGGAGAETFEFNGHSIWPAGGAGGYPLTIDDGAGHTMTVDTDGAALWRLTNDTAFGYSFDGAVTTKGNSLRIQNAGNTQWVTQTANVTGELDITTSGGGASRLLYNGNQVYPVTGMTVIDTHSSAAFQLAGARTDLLFAYELTKFADNMVRLRVSNSSVQPAVAADGIAATDALPAGFRITIGRLECASTCVVAYGMALSNCTGVLSVNGPVGGIYNNAISLAPIIADGVTTWGIGMNCGWWGEPVMWYYADA